MNLSYRWLADYIHHTLSPEQVAHELTFRAAPVEGLEKLPNGDTRIALEVTFNRADLLSHIGVAREIAAATGGTVVVAEPRPAEDPGSPAREHASVVVEAADLCPRYTARVIRGVKVKDSPVWLRERLEAIGVRPVNNVVDITNYVLFEYGQPLHAFDLATLVDRKILVRRARAGEEFVAIDRTRHELDPETLVIADGARPVAIAGIMGGLDTEISERTTDVLLESAYFDPVATRRAVRRLGLRSDSSYRFERGVDPAGVDAASRRAAALILEIAGGTLASGAIDVDAGTLGGPKRVTLRLSRLRLLTGIDIPAKEAARLLTSLGMNVVERGGDTGGGISPREGEALEVAVPTARWEVAREVDLIEEVLRTYGYDRVPLNPSIPIRVAPVAPRDRAIGRVKRLLVGAGWREVLTVSFVERDDAIDPPLFTDAPPLTVKNPVQPEVPALRRSLVPSLLRVRRNNLDAGNRGAKLFEVGTAYLPVANDPPREVAQLGLISDVDFDEMRGAVEAVLHELRLEPLVAFRSGEAGVFTEKQARLEREGKLLGVIGELLEHPQLSPRARQLYEALSKKQRPMVAVLDLDALVALAEAGGTLSRRFGALPQVPSVTRDLAIVVDATRAWQEIAETVARLQVPNLVRSDYIPGSLFTGGPIPAGKKSIAITMEFRAPDRTLTGGEADEGREKVKAALREALGAAFRE